MSHLHKYIDYLLLCYHEARNVRHLVKKGCAEAAEWEPLTCLPKNRECAWKELQCLRGQAKAATSVADVNAIMYEKLRKSLEELKELYQDQNWKHAKSHGGHAWVGITEAVSSLGESIESQDEERIAECLAKLAIIQHNTGRLSEKLKCLDQSLSK